MMMDMNDSERAHLTSFRELRDSEGIDVISDKEGEWLGESGVLRSIGETFPEWEGVILGPEIERCCVRVTELRSHWELARSPAGSGGEFAISNFYDCLFEEPPDLAWEESSEDEIKFFSELRVIDYSPRSGSGRFAAVRVQPGIDPLEVWFYDTELGPPDSDVSYLRMDVTYCEYLEALVLTKGMYNWQYLFTDIPLRGSWFEGKVAILRNMLTRFPELFPDYDYAPLRARLEERL